MSNDIVVEELVEIEKDDVRKVLVESYQQYEDAFEDPDFWDKYLGEIKSSLEYPYVDKILVAKLDGDILGTVQLFETAEKAYVGKSVKINAPFIRLLAVHPKSRGHGVGKKLINACVNYAKDKEAKSIYLFTGPAMTAAIRLYEKFGFVRDFEEEENNRDMDVICYRYDL